MAKSDCKRRTNMAPERNGDSEIESVFGEIPHVRFSPFHRNEYDERQCFYRSNHYHRHHGRVLPHGGYDGLAWGGDTPVYCSEYDDRVSCAAVHDNEKYNGGGHINHGHGICNPWFEMGLSDKLRKMVIDDENGLLEAEYGGDVKDGPVKNSYIGLSSYFDGEECSVFPDANLFDREKLLRLKLPEQLQRGKLSGVERLNGRHFYENLFLDSPRNTYFSRGNQVSNVTPCMERLSTFSEPLLQSQQIIGSCFGDRGRFCSLSSTPTVVRKPTLGVISTGNLLQRGLPINQSGSSSQAPTPPRSKDCFDALTCEDSFILKGKDLGGMPYNSKKATYYHNFERGALDTHLDPISMGHVLKAPELRILPAKDYFLLDIQGSFYSKAKDQTGCRLLQESLDEANPQFTEIVFNEIINHMVELMMDQFGNYLVQKLLDVCNEDQVMQILLVVTANPGGLVKISLNVHGSRAVQKLIASVRTQQQISLVVSALEQGFLALAKDLNGFHVVQCCLQYLSSESNKFIFCSAAKYCVNIATHRQGCCVLQRCIYHSSGKHREKLVANICANGLLLSQDIFGNYVVQYVIELKIPSAIAALSSQFKGNYVYLSTQKFSSHVVEKCLQYFGKEDQMNIINELLSASQFDKLLQDQYANYVIQHALQVFKGTSLHAMLVKAILPHQPFLRNSPYCKKLLSAANIK